MGFKSFCYDRFGPLGERIALAFPWLDRWLELSGSKIHPYVYASILTFTAIIMLIPASFSILLILTACFQLDVPPYLLPLLRTLSLLPIPLILLFLVSPVLVILVGSIIPIIVAQGKLYGFELELPYVASYLAVMVSSGLPLYEGLRRLKGSRIFRNTAKYISKLEAATLTKGVAPIFTLEKFANAMNIKGFKELVLGYVSTLRSGGDVADHVYRKAEILFKEMLSKVKSVADKLSLLMEACITVVCLGGIGLYLFFVVSISMSDVLGMPMPPEIFFLFSFVAIPAINGFFIYLADSNQISYPEKVSSRYTAFIAALPLIGLVAAGAVIPYVFGMQGLPQLAPFVSWIEGLTEAHLGNKGFTPAVMLCLCLIAGTIPAAIHEALQSRRSAAYSTGLTSFLRDLVETRKSGLTPEKCLVHISSRNYGGFSKILGRISRGIVWGLPLRKIYEELSEALNSWLISANLFLLVDTIEVGGGTVETLEVMARFSETSMLIEKERKALLRPLLFVPYLGAALLIMVSLSFLSFMNDMLTVAGTSLPMVTLVKILMTPLPLQMYMLGLTAGKIGSGRVSGGFIHATLLVAVTLLAFLLSPMINLGGFIGVGG